MATPSATSSTAYAWQGLAFDLPKNLDDRSVLQFVGDPPLYNLVVTRESLGGAALPIFIQERVRELSSLFPSYALAGQEKRQVAGHNCSLITQDVTTPEGIAVRQVQAYVAVGDEASIFTATAPADDNGWAQTTIDAVLQSLKIG